MTTIKLAATTSVTLTIPACPPGVRFEWRKEGEYEWQIFATFDLNVHNPHLLGVITADDGLAVAPGL